MAPVAPSTTRIDAPATDRGTSAIIVGGGVVGLTAAWHLLEDGWSVHVWSGHDALETTSAVAAAVWHPFLLGPTPDAPAWAARSHAVFSSLAGIPDAGVIVREALEYTPAREPLPDWCADVGGSAIDDADLPAHFGGGHRFAAPVIVMPIYLRWLEARVRSLGGAIVRRTIERLEDAAGSADLVVHCAGLAAHRLVGDRDLRPVRGQILRVRPFGVDRVVLFEGPPNGAGYVIPRLDDVIVGGSAHPGEDDLEPRPALTEAILARAAEVVPEVAGCEILEVRVGLRPVRSSGVRLDDEVLPGGTPVIHDYGHGGAGVTLSIGCAEAVRARAAELVPPRRPESGP